MEDDTDVPEGRRVERIAIDPSNKEAVDDFFNKSVAVLQESAMKEILKKIIKVIEPKKQSKYPYQSSETKIKKGLDPRVRYPVPMVPPWWPKEGVIHKEPDHIQKEGMLAFVLIGLPTEGSALSFDTGKLIIFRASTTSQPSSACLASPTARPSPSPS